MKNKLYFFLLCFIVNILKFFPIGYIYRPLQDDYIQYWAYSNYPNIYNDVIKKIGLLNVRPLAGIFDIYVWSNFWGNMFIALLIITLLHFFSCYIFYNTFANAGYSIGSPFVITYLLFPLGFEAVYWISASSRIVVSMFFISIMLCHLIKFLHYGKYSYFIIYATAQLFSIGFYEQTAVISAVCVLWFTITQKSNINFPLKKCIIKNKKYVVFSFLLSWIFLCLYYIIFSSTGSFGDRSSNLLKNIELSQFVNTANAVSRVFQSCTDLFSQGLSPNIFPVWIVIVIAILCAFLGCTLNNSNTYNIKNSTKKLILGIILFVSAFIVHALIKSEYIPYRCTAPSLLGLGLIIDAISDIILSKKYLKSITVSMMAFIFVMANCYQALCLRNISDIDKEICINIISYINRENLDISNEIIISPVKELYINVPLKYNDYILKNVTASDWALTGATRAYAQNLNIKKLIPKYD